MQARIRCAAPEDIQGIAALVEIHARRGEVLPRSVEIIQANIDDWVVAVRGRSVLACGSLQAYSTTLNEVRSLVVSDQEKRQGLGKAILKDLIEEAQLRGVSTLFALTRTAPFFERAGFERSDRFRFPEKVWQDCVICPIQDDCDEFAVVLFLDGQSNTVERLEINDAKEI